MENDKKKKNFKLQVLMYKLESGEELYSLDQTLLDELGLKEKTLRRYLQELEDNYHNVIATDMKHVADIKRKVKIYFTKNPKKNVASIFKYFMNSDSNYDWIIPMILENDPEFMNQITDKERDSLEKMLGKGNEPYLFVKNPFESLKNQNNKEIFESIKNAVMNREYRKIIYGQEPHQVIDNAKCLKIVFVDDNWYLAIENEEKNFRLLRVAFIKECLETYDKNTYQKSVLEKYNDYFLNLQNSLTLYGVDKKIARLKIDKEKSHYFSKDMKLFFPSQVFIKQNDDGSVEIDISYTQPLEILPFIKRWMPSMHIISPDDLKVEYKNDLEKALEYIS
jgi:hypothetical protein